MYTNNQTSNFIDIYLNEYGFSSVESRIAYLHLDSNSR